MKKFERWVDWIRDEHDDIAYRYVYLAYLVIGGGHERTAGMVTMTRADGGWVVRAGGDEELRLADDVEREALARYLEDRYRADRYPDMAAWEAQQDAWYEEDKRDRFGR